MAAQMMLEVEQQEMVLAQKPHNAELALIPAQASHSVTIASISPCIES